MEKGIRYNCLMMILATMLFSTFAQAQINVIYFNGSKKKLLETYLPESHLHPDQNKIIEELQRNARKVRAMSSVGAWGSLSVLNDKIITKKQILFYYKDIAYDTIKLYVDKAKLDKAKSGQVAVNNIAFVFDKKDDAQQFAESLFYIQQLFRVDQLTLAKEYEKKLSEFQITAKAYYELKEKPIITEEQRKYIVQANAMNEKKEYGKAIELYNKALEINPVAYPGAYYNLALLCAQTKEFQQAIYNIKKYLLLVPDAPDARAAQDKIYEWEAEPKD